VIGLRLTAALLLPWAVGVSWLRHVWRVPLSDAPAALLGYGYLAGMVVTPLVMLGLDAAGFGQGFLLIAAILVALAVAGLCLPRGGGPRRVAARAARTRRPLEAAAFALLLSVIGVRLAGFALEVVWRPLYPWDAWMNWAPKARVWLEHRRLVPFVSLADWVAQPGHALYSLQNHHYPPVVPLIQLWIGLALGRWDESLINLPWVLCGLALALAFYGQLRHLGGSALFAICGTYLLVSLPALGTHIALAGYADLWVATLYGLAAMAFYRWVREGDRGQGITALLLTAALPLVKVPGLGWALTMVPALLVARRRGRAVALTIAGTAGSAVLLAMGRVPGVGDLAFHPVWSPFAENLFVLANWHLLWLAAPVLLALSARRLRSDDAYRALLTLLLGGFMLLFGVFFFTSRHIEATDFSTLNRALLHLVPALAFALAVAALGLVEAESGPRSATIEGASTE